MLSSSSDSFPPIHGTYGAVLDWLQDQRGTRFQDLLRYSPAFSEQGFDPGEEELRYLWDTDGWVSWLGGPAVDLGAWPHATDGNPLTHVATIDLAGLAGAIDRAGKATWPADQIREGLPRRGILQVFHDLRTSGHAPDDRARGAWAVVVTEDPAYPTGDPAEVPAGQRPQLVTAPSPETTPSPDTAPTPVCQLVLPFSGFALPSPLDLAPEKAGDVEELEDLTEALQLAWMTQRHIGGSYAIPTSHAYGYSSRGHHHATLDVLPGVLPLADGDEYRLILEIEGWTVLEGWFGDGGSLEVWMRQSDLDAGAFGNAWCLLRTD